MASLNGFNAANVDPTNSFDPVPAGDYVIVFTDSEMKPTKSGDGEYLQMVAEIIEGPYKGRKLWERLNLNNRNQTAVEIAQRSLSQICHAVGVLQPQDSVELHHKPLVAVVSYKPAEGAYGAGNEIKGYKAYGNKPATKPAPTVAQQAQEAAAAQASRAAPAPARPAASATPPWAQ